MRKRSSVLIGDDLLIDLGPDLMSSAFACSADVSRVRFVLQTHSHSDHFDAGHLITRIADYAVQGILPLDICASTKTLEHMSERLSYEESGATLLNQVWQDRLNVQIHPLHHGDTIELGGRRITAIESNHDPRDESLIYAIEENGKAFLYATDTMRLTNAAWALFEQRDLHFDAVAIDHTYGPGTYGGGHLCADQVAEEVAKLRSSGVLKPDGRVLATHISHEGMPLHEELEQFARSHGYEVAWDGLKLEL